MSTPPDFLREIIARKRREVERRKRHMRPLPAERRDAKRRELAQRALRRQRGAAPRIIAEVKFCSPSAGPIRPWAPGEAQHVARAYAAGGAAAISVLADAPGFGGSSLTVRRVARAVELPILYKEFVLDPIQVDLAYQCGASMVLLLVNSLGVDELQQLVGAAQARGLEPVVEAATESELQAALGTSATIIGINARDLHTFRVDMLAARQCIEAIPADRIAVFMSGVREPADFEVVASTRADAVLIGEGAMRADDPATWLRALAGPG